MDYFSQYLYDVLYVFSYLFEYHIFIIEILYMRIISNHIWNRITQFGSAANSEALKQCICYSVIMQAKWT